MSEESVFEVLTAAREREFSRTRYYRALAAVAEIRDEPAAAERLNGLLADEHHHLSRITARLMELGAQPPRLEARPDVPEWEEWESDARAGEVDEVAWYEQAVEAAGIDQETRELLEEILISEQKHRDELGGKWMSAS